MEEKQVNDKKVDEKKREKLPLDAKLLASAIIELNISRRSVGLYPPDHPITVQSIKRAHALLNKLFEIRNSISLGVAKNRLVIDEYKLDRKNPVFNDFAIALHAKGIAAITFYSGLEEKELVEVHQLIADKDLPVGRDLVELYKAKELKHVRLTPLDMSKLNFVEGVQKKEGDSSKVIWENYVHGLMDGNLADSEAESLVLKIPPGHFAHILNTYSAEDRKKSYERIITSYLRKRDNGEINKEAYKKFVKLVENLNPEIKEQLLLQTLKHKDMSFENAEELFGQLNPDDIEQMIEIAKKQANSPQSVRNILDKLSKASKINFKQEDIVEDNSRLDDIEIDEEMMSLFEDDQFGEFVEADYQQDLEKMLSVQTENGQTFTETINKAMSMDSIDNVYSAIIFKLMHFEGLNKEQCLNLLNRLSELVEMYLETGRFEEILQIHNTLYSFMLEGRFKTETSGMIEYFLHSEHFIAKLLDAFRVWGRREREAALRLSKVLGTHLVVPLLEALCVEEQASQRRFYISILKHLGKDVLHEAVKRLDDERWYVKRNMLYLIRECGGKEYSGKIKNFLRHKNKQVCIEALKALLHFNTPDLSVYLKYFFKEQSPELKEKAIELSGVYRIKAAVPLLLEIIEQRGIMDVDMNHKFSAVKALGRIGDPSALDVLKRLYSRSRFSFYKGVTEELKVEIIRSLVGYPFEDAVSLIELATSSKNEKARTLAKELFERRIGVKR
jgi:hypothetical protein